MRDFVLIGLAITLPAPAQTNSAIRLHPVPRFTIAADALAVRRAVEAQRPFTAAGPSSALLGEQSGKLEAWLYPVKILSQLAITAELANYGTPIAIGPRIGCVVRNCVGTAVGTEGLVPAGNAPYVASG